MEPRPAAVAAEEEPREYDLDPPAAYVRAVQAGTRSTSGAPGPAYWQNSVSYRIDAELDPAESLIRGWERITYRNNSPSTLSSIVLNLSQNVFAEGVPRNRYVPITGGFTIDRVSAQGQTLSRMSPTRIPVAQDLPAAPAGYAVQGTLGRVKLPRPLEPGDSVLLEIDWRHRIPPAGAFRTGWEDALGSRAFHVAQWYPQVATFDDLRGWDATPYLGDGEFYLEYGDFDVSVTVPAGFLVGSTGTLTNPEEVLTEEARQRLSAAIESDSVTRIVTGADLGAENATQPAVGGQLTWRFVAHNVRDFAFAASAGYVWDVTGAALSSGTGGTRIVPVHAFYRPDAANWQQAARYGQHAIERIDRMLIPYIYPQLTIAEGPVGGMEYPMLVFIGKPSAPESLYRVIAHEIAHQWFPMMVGQDEAAYAWMDEGFATFLENRTTGDFFDVSDAFNGDLAGYLSVAGSEHEVPIMRHTDLVTPYGARGIAAYSKPGVLLRTLGEVVGEEAFQDAVTTYAREWLLKRPTPWDFFSTMERVTGRELDWFFHPWWFETSVLDQAITSVEGAESGSAVVTVANLGDVPAPTLLVAHTADGRSISAEVPVETWLAGEGSATVTLEAQAPIVHVEIDPEEIFPDAVPENDVWGEAPPPAAQ